MTDAADSLDGLEPPAPLLAATVTAIVVAPHGATDSLHMLIDELADAGIIIDTLTELGDVAALVDPDAPPPVLLLDLLGLGAAPEDLEIATQLIDRARKVAPRTTPIALTDRADLVLVLACVRAGAGDVLDLTLEDATAAIAIVHRVFRTQAEREAESQALAHLRGMIEDMFRDLIRTERRSIDLEEKLAAHQRVSGEMPAIAAIEQQRPPAVLVIEPDRQLAGQLAERLEAEGVSTFAYLNGEHALREARLLIADGTPFDLALVAVQLPGIDGLVTVQRLREHVHGLPAFLLTSVHDADIAEHAADLGVVGFVHKPLADLDEIVGRLRELANESLLRTREHTYLQRIKERHERVLASYRALPPT